MLHLEKEPPQNSCKLLYDYIYICLYITIILITTGKYIYNEKSGGPEKDYQGQLVPVVLSFRMAPEGGGGRVGISALRSQPSSNSLDRHCVPEPQGIAH